MRKLLIVFLCLTSVLCLSSCDNNDTAENREPVVINMPKDDSVNGYRTEDTYFEDDLVISDDKVGIDTAPSQNITNKDQVIGNQTSNVGSTISGNENGAYCANKNSGVFHKAECSSVAKMKQENKVYFESSELAISNGYKPCGRCKP